VPNFYSDNSDILFHINNMDLSAVLDLKERHYSDKGQYPEAPQDYEDAMDNCKRLLDIIGDISGNFVAPRAPAVDAEGARFKDGEVIYAKGTAEAIDILNKAELMGFTIPRRYGGINMPKTLYAMAIEIVSRADASLMNIFGLQDISDTISKFSDEDQKQRYLPRFCSGEVMGSMALTEPDAGSDLQAVMLKATEDKDGVWHLNGVKRFITNGCAKISLVMARSENGMAGGRGISLFIYERDSDMKIRRIEHKLGIKGSPTCELQFKNAKAELLGKRKMGLVRYTMSLMNGARLAIAAQAVGIAEAAYREAYSYANDRIQFKKEIREFSAVYEMLTNMKIAIEGGRTLMYETSRIVDIKENMEEMVDEDPSLKDKYKEDIQKYSRYAGLFTPLLKYFTTEMGNKVCYDALQIHGGVGFTTEFNVERHYRDIRITNIYEGTSQLQVVGALGGVITGTVSERLDEYEANNNFAPIADIFDKAKGLRASLEKGIAHIKEKGDSTYQEYHAERLVKIAADTVISYLFCLDALKSDRKKKVAAIFIAPAQRRVQESLEAILSDNMDLIRLHKDIIDQGE